MYSRVAKIAISKAAYHIDRPYDYSIPDELAGRVLPGMRVLVDFSRYAAPVEGLVLALSSSSRFDHLKPVIRILDEKPVLSVKQIKLALFMRERYFCTIYDALRTILPAGMFFDDSGKRKIKDAFREIAVLNIPYDEAVAFCQKAAKKAPQQAHLLEVLADFGSLSSKDLLLYSGASRASLVTLKKKGLLSFQYVQVFRRPEIGEHERKSLPVLTSRQSEVYKSMLDQMSADAFFTSLLFGVTGSGKSCIYAHLIRSCLEKGRSVIFLVPEIALTPQFIKEYSSYFGREIAIIHSGLSDGERLDEWKRISSGAARLVIGTRSAVFAPVSELGLIIVDEEQEDSYKSESSPRYNAREIAAYRCADENCGLLLGSATPDVCSMYKAQQGRYSLLTLPERFNRFDLPEVRVVDMKDELLSGNSGMVSTVMREELAGNIERKEQSLIFLNRRGTSRAVSCQLCGFVYKCPRCSVSLSYHGREGRMICHYCGYSRKPDPVCPDCGGDLRQLGSGTQKIEDVLSELFPGIRILRLDRDAVSQTGEREKILSMFVDEKIPILVGTQMIGKGHNFSNVTLSGVISADQSLYSGNYRAAEKTFSILTQVIGRSGRAEKRGRAVIQTLTPDNPVIRFAAKQDYMSYYEYEIAFRRLQNMPPFSELIALVAVGKIEKTVVSCTEHIRSCLAAETASYENVSVIGPSPLPVARVNEKYRYAVYVSCPEETKINTLISNIIIGCSLNKAFKGITVYADRNPL